MHDEYNYHDPVHASAIKIIGDWRDSCEILFLPIFRLMLKSKFLNPVYSKQELLFLLFHLGVLLSVNFTGTSASYFEHCNTGVVSESDTSTCKKRYNDNDKHIT